MLILGLKSTCRATIFSGIQFVGCPLCEMKKKKENKKTDKDENMPHNKVFKKEGISQNNNLHIIYKVLFTYHLQVSMSEKKNHAVFPSRFGSVLSINQF
jgi:hypothetical protein